jgi:hypothetical protein
VLDDLMPGSAGEVLARQYFTKVGPSSFSPLLLGRVG